MEEQLDHLLRMYERGSFNRRQLVQALLGLGVAGAVPMRAHAAPADGALFQAHTMNHVTIYSSDVARSKAFYQRLAGLPIRDEGKDFCEFRVKGGFLGVYAPEEKRPGFDHFCLGVEDYNAKRAHAQLREAFPEGKPTIENEDQVYVRDPDGVRVQIADVNYKQ